jgi:ABC-type multidrug transport system fused ATPase/permease subunit
MKKLISQIYMGIKICKLISFYEPMYILWSLFQIIFNAVLPLIYVYFPKLLIENLINGSDYSQIVIIVTLFLLIILFINMMNQYFSGKCSLLAEKFTLDVKNDMGLLTMKLELADIEMASSRDIILLASNVSQVTDVMSLVQRILSNLITILGLSYIIVQLDWLFIALVIVTLLIKTVFVKIQHQYRQKQRLKFTQNDRVGNYLTDVTYYNSGTSKEIRINSAQGWMMKKITAWRNGMVTLQYVDYGIFTLLQVLSVVITTVQSFIILWVLSSRYISGMINIADFTMYFSAVATITISLGSISDQIGDYNRQILNLSDFEKLTSIKLLRNRMIHNTESDFSIPQKVEITFHNVCFTYPKCDKQALNCVNITIRNNEKLVIVGQNGAGKTTFIKLICKFYRPTSGYITLNGTDIWDIPNETYYKIISAVFQDFTNLVFSIRENIILNHEVNDNAFTDALVKAGLDDYVNSLKSGANTYISKQFNENGIELSGGQEQKLAIARALYKNCPVLILDEPTASLDPKAESEIYTNFFKVAKEKTTIFVSHRLAASLKADTIAVFSDGQIVEYGTHRELMNLNGLYAVMFDKQSRPYINRNFD